MLGLNKHKHLLCADLCKIHLHLINGMLVVGGVSSFTDILGRHQLRLGWRKMGACQRLVNNLLTCIFYGLINLAQLLVWFYPTCYVKLQPYTLCNFERWFVYDGHLNCNVVSYRFCSVAQTMATMILSTQELIQL